MVRLLEGLMGDEIGLRLLKVYTIKWEHQYLIQIWPKHFSLAQNIVFKDFALV